MSSIITLLLECAKATTDSTRANVWARVTIAQTDMT